MSSEANPLCRIAADVKLGRNVRLPGFINLYGCTIGDDTRIGTFVEIQKGAVVGNNCKIQSHSFLCEGVTLEDEVFVGHGVMFTNDRFPRATNDEGLPKNDAEWSCEKTIVKRGASIGSNATILCGLTIGERAIVGAGSVVTKDVPAGAIVAGNPARVLRKISKAGTGSGAGVPPATRPLAVPAGGSTGETPVGLTAAGTAAPLSEVSDSKKSHAGSVS